MFIDCVWAATLRRSSVLVTLELSPGLVSEHVKSMVTYVPLFIASRSVETPGCLKKVLFKILKTNLVTFELEDD